MADRIGDWMVTATGRQYWPLDPRPGDVDIVDVATHLAKECRYNGACLGHYSVAEHSVLVSMVVPPQYALQGLMHDAPESYLKDLTRPVKRGVGQVYADLEELNWRAIAERFGIDPELHASVKAADDSVLMAERYALFPDHKHMWSVKAEPAAVKILGLSWQGARDAFLRRWQELTG